MEELDLKEILSMFWEKKILIIIITVLCMIIGGVYSYFIMVPEYTATTTIVLTKTDEKTNAETGETTESITQTDVMLNQNLVATYSVIIKSNNILREVISNLENLKLSENSLRDSIEVTAKEDTEVIEINVTDINAKNATLIANEISEVFSRKVSEIYKINNVYVLDKAEVPTAPSNINHIRFILISAAVGIIISCGYVVIRNLFDNSIKKKEDIENALDMPVLVSLDKSEGEQKVVISDKESKSILAESVRTLRTNLQFMGKSKKTQTILVTSTTSGEGKSWVSSNLAAAYAQTGKRTILVDSDMRKGSINTIFDLPQTPGLSNYLSGVNISENGLAEVLQKTEIENLYVITAGDIPPNPSELILSDQMLKLFEDLETFADVIIFDGTPSLIVTDSTILSRLVDSTVLVAEYNRTKKNDLKQIKESITKVGGKIAGVVLNKIPVKNKKGYGYGYAYGYAYGYINNDEARNIHEKAITKKKSSKVKEAIISFFKLIGAFFYKIINTIYKFFKAIIVMIYRLIKISCIFIKNLFKKAYKKPKQFFNELSNKMEVYIRNNEKKTTKYNK